MDDSLLYFPVEKDLQYIANYYSLRTDCFQYLADAVINKDKWLLFRDKPFLYWVKFYVD